MIKPIRLPALEGKKDFIEACSAFYSTFPYEIYASGLEAYSIRGCDKASLNVLITSFQKLRRIYTQWYLDCSKKVTKMVNDLHANNKREVSEMAAKIKRMQQTAKLLQTKSASCGDPKEKQHLLEEVESLKVSINEYNDVLNNLFEKIRISPAVLDEYNRGMIVVNTRKLTLSQYLGQFQQYLKTISYDRYDRREGILDQDIAEELAKDVIKLSQDDSFVKGPTTEINMIARSILSKGKVPIEEPVNFPISEFMVIATTLQSFRRNSEAFVSLAQKREMELSKYRTNPELMDIDRYHQFVNEFRIIENLIEMLSMHFRSYILLISATLQTVLPK